MDKLTIGIIGAGRIAKVHALSISNNLRNVNIKWVADYKLEAIGDWADDLEIPEKTDNHMDILNDPAVDAVLICSSTDTHAQFIVDAAQAGKHIFCEKPISLDIEEIENALAEVENAGVKLQIGFNRRFDKNFRKVKKLASDGTIGDTHIVKITSRDPEPPPIEYVKVSGGIFLDMAIHDFDMARYLTDSEVDEVYVSGAVLVDEAIGEAGDIDTAVINLKMKDGSLCVIDNSRKAVYGYDQRVEVFGSKGKAEANNETPTTVKVSTKDGVIGDNPKYFFLERYMEAYSTEIAEFVDAIVNDKAVPVSGFDGLQPVKIGLAAKKSVETGQPVKVK
jgi:myo-inositol 2-dehydrogenase/D-chiro-inositol 1-dehydrogenase